MSGNTNGRGDEPPGCAIVVEEGAIGCRIHVRKATNIEGNVIHVAGAANGGTYRVDEADNVGGDVVRIGNPTAPTPKRSPVKGAVGSIAAGVSVAAIAKALGFV